MKVHKPTYHCLFEQSGTFKNEFKKLGYKSFDYDILNEYGETDYVVDLFDQIDRAYHGLKSIFDDIYPNQDMIIAFFPCVTFEQQIAVHFRGEAPQHTNYDDVKKLELDLKLHSDLNRNYETITKLCIVCLKRGIPLIIENPYCEQHYLKRYWCMKPKLIDTNRRENGDHYWKPTQYWFINCEPQNNLVMEALEYNEYKKVEGPKKDRSLIAPQYARRFIKEYILKEGE